MPSCSVKCCTNWNGNTTNKGIKFYRFPADAKIADIWIKACANQKVNLKNAGICSIHFTEDCFEQKPEHLIVPGDINIIRLSKTAIPTINLENDGTKRRGKKRKVQDCKQNHESLKKPTNNLKLFTLVNDKENVCAIEKNIEKQRHSFTSITSNQKSQLKEQCSTELRAHGQTHNCEVAGLQEENTNFQASAINNFLQGQTMI